MRYNPDNSEMMSLVLDNLSIELDPTLLKEGCSDIWYS